MNYKTIYDDFISDRREKEIELKRSGGYYERHHVSPVLQGRDDSPANLICLTAGDHFFAHLCLAKAYGGKHWKAVEAMVNMPGSSCRRDLIPVRRWVERARTESAKFHSTKAKAQHAKHGLTEKSHTPLANMKRSETVKQYIHWTDGERSVRIKAHETPPAGFWRGRTIFNKSHYSSPEYKQLLSERSKTMDRSYMTGESNVMRRMTPQERQAWREKTKEAHNRPEVRAKKGARGDKNVMRANPSALMKMIASNKINAERKKRFCEESAYAGDRRRVTKEMVESWFSGLKES